MTSIQKVETSKAPDPKGSYSQAIKAGDFLFVSGQIPIDPQTRTLVEHSIEAQTIQVLNNIKAILDAEGLSFENVVKCEVYLKDMKDFETMNRIYGELFSHSIKPARQTLQVVKIPLDALIEISCIAYCKKQF